MIAPGKTFKRRGQSYRRVGSFPYELRRGGWIEIMCLESVCPDCGRVFECTATKKAIRRGYLVRRCEKHRRPGVPVAERPPPRRGSGKAVRNRAAPPPRMAPRTAPVRPTLLDMLA